MDIIGQNGNDGEHYDNGEEIVNGKVVKKLFPEEKLDDLTKTY